MEAVAKIKYLKGSPQKARLVIDLVRGKNVSKALAILQFTNKRAASPIAKCIKSAIANATYKAEQQNIAIDPDDLWVKRCFVDQGPTKNRRRLRPAPQGRAYFERRHYCHITVELTSDPIADDKPAFDPANKKPIKKKAEKAEVKEVAAPAVEETIEETVEAPEVEAAETEAVAEDVPTVEEASEASADESADESPESEGGDEAPADENAAEEEAAGEEE